MSTFEDPEGLTALEDVSEVKKRSWTTKYRRTLMIGSSIAAIGLVAAPVALFGMDAMIGLDAIEEEHARLFAEFIEAGEYCISPSGIQESNIGGWGGGQSLDGLLQKTLTGTTDEWLNYLEYTLNAAKQHESYLTFDIPVWMKSDVVQGVAMDVNFMGERGSDQLWELQIRNVNQLKWETIWDNTGPEITSWVWSSTKTIFPLSPLGWGQYVGSTNKAQVRLVSRTGVTLNALFDYISLCVTVAEGTPPPTPAPVSTPPTSPPRESCFGVKQVQSSVVGTTGFGQSATQLATKDLSGSADEWYKYVEFGVAGPGHDTRLIVEIDPSQVPTELVGIRAKLNMRGPRKLYQEWSVQVLNRNTNNFVTVIDNGDAPSWTWFEATSTIAATDPLQYIDGSNTLVFRVFTSSNEDAFQLDFASFCLVGKDDDVPLPPTPPPTAPPPTTTAPPPTTTAPPPTTTAPAPTTTAPAPTNDPGPTEGCFFADSIISKKGATGFGQSSLQLLEQSVTPVDLEDWYKYVQFTAAADGGEWEFNIPVDRIKAPRDIGGLRIYTNFRGLNADLQTWKIEALNLDLSDYRTVFVNTDNVGWVWTSLLKTIAASNINSYVTDQNVMKFRLTTPNNLDTFQIDFLKFCLVSRDDDLPPPPETASPTIFQPTAAPEPGTCFETTDDFESHTFNGGICGTQINRFLSDTRVREVLDDRLNQGCSMIQLDTILSVYLNDTEFQREADFIDFVSTEAHIRGIKVTIYYPSLEIITINGENLESTAYKDHPEWIQKGLNGKSNVFYGAQEDWVNPGEESAWMDPENDEFVQYFTNRLLVLAQTEVDSLWLDVPLYYDTGIPWSGGTDANAAAFKVWSQGQGLCVNTNGCPLPGDPEVAGYDQPIFKYWLVWRHYSLANFLDRLRSAVRAVRPNMDFFIENYPTDYMDGAQVSLDHSVFTPEMRKGMSSVWEIDSVSNKNAMQFASVEDFASQIAMRKYANGVDKSSPTWNFVYTNEKIDMGFALAGSLAVGNIPFETKTPKMDDTASVEGRTDWFTWLNRRSCEVLRIPREAEAAVLYSGASRDVRDLFTTGCGYAMYNQIPATPSNDADWWAFIPSVSALNCPHVGSYRAAQYGLQQLHVPYKVVTDFGLEASDLEGIKMLWLPHTEALDVNAAAIIDNWVKEGGTLLASGAVPGQYNKFGQTVSSGSSLSALFGGVLDQARYVVPYGKGTAIMRTDFNSRDLFALGERRDAVKQAKALDTLEQMVRIHVPERFVLEQGDHVFVERSIEFNDKQYLYMVNYAGMQQPATNIPQNLKFWYRPPPGKRVASVDVSTPNKNINAWNIPNIEFTRNEGSEWVRIPQVGVDQFSMFTFNLIDAPEPTPIPQQKPWNDALVKESAELGLRYVLDKMRDPTRDGAYKYGVFTNVIDTEEFNPLYAFGHHTTAENQGLLLRSTACMGDKDGFDESVEYIDKIMISPLYRLINWAMDRRKKHAFLTYDDYNNVWISANAPLDDFRAILGLFEGADRFGNERAREIGEAALNAIYWTSISDRYRVTPKYPQYPGGIVGYAFDWAEVNSDELDPPGISSGIGYLYDDNIPVDYNDLDVLYLATRVNPRFIATLKSSLQMILESEIPSVPGLFFNNLNKDKTWRGDFEFEPTEAAGQNLKTIQVLWTALHLAGAETFSVLSDQEKTAALNAAQRCYQWFKEYYLANNKIIPEYLTYAGEQVPRCGPGVSGNCMDRFANSAIGEARIYGQFARLGWLLGEDQSFINQVYLDKIRSDQVLDVNDERYGMIGIEALGVGSLDAESFNILEAVMSMCRSQLNTRHNEFPRSSP